ncbi:TetR/AcrR family transcriptional regulator [Kitasatospora sp. NPDC058032]|uniref:TetR/AcrR family transcriptional regulator n=1 Tax=Kitasatospora sp. NPDC058032 TaxID=3346307 RepID=UPI0036DE52EB
MAAVARQQNAPDPSRRNEQSRTAILTAAGELVAEIGFGKLTIEKIAARAGVGKQTIYRWWPSKGAVVFDSFLAANENASGSLALPDTGDLTEDLRTLLRGTVLELADPAFNRTGRALAAEVLTDPDLLREYRERLLDPLLEVTRDRLRAAREAGQLRADADLDLAVELLYGPLYYRWLHGLGSLDADYADQVAAALLSAFGTTGG